MRPRLWSNTVSSSPDQRQRRQVRRWRRSRRPGAAWYDRTAIATNAGRQGEQEGACQHDPAAAGVLPAPLHGRRRRAAQADARLLEEAGQHGVGVEVLLRERARGGGGERRSPRRCAARPPRRPPRSVKAEQPLPDGKVGAEAGVLHEHRAAGREVAHGAVAEPAAVRLDVDALRDRELRAGSLHVVAELERPGDGRARVDQAPAVAPRAPSRSRWSPGWMSSAISNRCGDAPRQLDHLAELVHLQRVGVPAEVDRAERARAMRRSS